MYFCFNVTCPYLYSHLCIYILYNVCVYVLKRLAKNYLYEIIKYILCYLIPIMCSGKIYVITVAQCKAALLHITLSSQQSYVISYTCMFIARLHITYYIDLRGKRHHKQLNLMCSFWSRNSTGSLYKAEL